MNDSLELIKPTTYPQGFDPPYTTQIQDGDYWQQNDGSWILRYSRLGVEKYARFSSEEQLLKDSKGYTKVTPTHIKNPKYDYESKNNDNGEKQGPIPLTIGAMGGKAPESATLRFPDDQYIDANSDYVFFQFGKYNPPFTAEGSGAAGGKSKERYDASANFFDLENIPGIILPMPQDLGNDLQQSWAGKSFSRLGRDAIQAVSGGDMSRLGDNLSDIEGNLTAVTTALKVNILNKLPGVGGNLTIGDVTGATKGIVFNPNAELLYEAPELREIGMTFKLVPKSADEASAIASIVKWFRYASAPAWGGVGDAKQFNFDSKESSGTYGKDGAAYDVFDSDNFMRVPSLCKFTFYTGPTVHPTLAQFKPCALNRVAVNYTPDGSYASLPNGEPVAVELQLNFTETKILFKSDIEAGF